MGERELLSSLAKSVLLEAQVVRCHADHVVSALPIEGSKLGRDRGSVSIQHPLSVPAAA